jgi:hypothetical protein
MRDLTIQDVGRRCGLQLPRPGQKCKCPFRKHKRKDDTFRVFLSRAGTELYKCWSCDEPNVGDAIALYARYNNIDRRRAVEELEKDGFDIPHRKPRNQGDSGPKRVYVPPAHGTVMGPVLQLDMKAWHDWRRRDTGVLDRFSEQRRVSKDLMRELDVVEVANLEQVLAWIQWTRKPVDDIRGSEM